MDNRMLFGSQCCPKKRRSILSPTSLPAGDYWPYQSLCRTLGTNCDIHYSEGVHEDRDRTRNQAHKNGIYDDERMNLRGALGLFRS